jgi:hypothetical protein
MISRVILVSPTDLRARLSHTVLWRSEIDRVHARDADLAYDMARQLRPKMLVVDAPSLADALGLLRRLRQDETTREASLVALLEDGRGPGEGALLEAGANLVLTPTMSTFDIDFRLERLLDVPKRRETRLAASLQLWYLSEPAGPLREAVVLNLSVRGMLIETKEALPLATTVEIRLSLPGDGSEEALDLMGRVERRVEEPDGRFHSGVQFLILRDRVRDRLRTFIESETKE